MKKEIAMENTKRIIIGITDNDEDQLLRTRDGFTKKGQDINKFCQEVYGVKKWYYDKQCEVSPYFGAYNIVEISIEKWKNIKDMVGNLDIFIIHEDDEEYPVIFKWLFSKKTRIRK